MTSKIPDLTREELDRLFKLQSYATAAQRCRDALRGGKAGLPRSVLQHALALALVVPVEEHRAALARQGGGRLASIDPSEVKDVEEAAAIFEELLCLDGAAREAAGSLGDTPGNAAQCFLLLRGMVSEPRDPQQKPEPAVLFGVLVEEAVRLVTARRLKQAEALLTRAHEIALAVEGEGGPGVRGALHVLRELRLQVGDRMGAAINANAADHERALDAALLALDEEGQAAYLHVVYRMAAGAWSGTLFGLSRRIQLHGMAMARHAAKRSGDSTRLAELLLQLGRTCLGATDFGGAFQAYEELRRLAEAAGPAQEWHDAALAGLGRAQIGLGDLELGRELLQRALGATPRTAESGWHSDAVLHAYEAALEAGDRAMATACHDSLARAGNTRGSSREEIEGRALEATDASRALARYEGVLGGIAKEPERGSAMRRLGFRIARLLAARGDLQQAHDRLNELHRAALTVLHEDHPFLSEVEGFAAELECALGRHEWGLRALFKATSRDSRAAANLLQAGSAAPRNRVLRGMRSRVEAVIGLVAEHFRDASGFIGGAHAVAMRRKGLNLAIEWQTFQQVARRSATDPAIRAARERLAGVRARLAQAALDRAHGGGAALEAALREKEEVEREIAYLLGGIAVEGLIDSANPASISMTLPTDSAYVDYYRYTPIGAPGAPPRPARYCAFVIPARYLSWQVVDLGEAEKVDRLVAAYRAEVAAQGGRAEDRFATVEPRGFTTDPTAEPGREWRRRTRAGHRLRRRILDPLKPAIGERTRLLVSPDGPLLSVPLDCLPTDDGGHVLDTWCISNVSSARSASYLQGEVIRSAEAVAAAPPSIVVGDPAYDLGGATARVRFRPLPGSREEAVAVARILRVPPLLDATATKAAVVAASSPLILHLATHGYVLGTRETEGALAGLPLARTGLAFAGANAAAGAEHAILLGEEVLSLDLRSTALAVLSACETGLGDPEHGEGLASLGRAFETAGARAVLVGLWKVPDRATCDLMEHFYRALAAGAGCADAIRQAKLEARKQRPSVHDWGAFVCFGGWGTIAIGQAPTAPPR